MNNAFLKFPNQKAYTLEKGKDEDKDLGIFSESENLKHYRQLMSISVETEE